MRTSPFKHRVEWMGEEDLICNGLCDTQRLRTHGLDQSLLLTDQESKTLKRASDWPRVILSWEQMCP